MLVDGVVAGIWHSRTARARAHVTVETWAPLDAGRRAAVEEQVGRVGEVLGVRAALEIGPVTAGPHA